MLGQRKKKVQERKSRSHESNESSSQDSNFNKRVSKGFGKKSKNSDKSSNSGSSESKRYFLRSNKSDDISMNAYDEVQALYVESLKGSSSGKEGSGSMEKKSSIQSTKDSKDTVAPHEKRFTNMRRQEKKACFNNLAKEIKVMRRKFTRFNKSVQRKEIQEQALLQDQEFLRTCHAAQQVLNETPFELPDCPLVLQNLSKIIIDGSLGLDSLEFYQICTLVRKVMKKDLNKDAKIPLTMKEHLFLSQATKQEIVSFYTGHVERDVKPQPPTLGHVQPQMQTAPNQPIALAPQAFNFAQPMMAANQHCQLIPVAFLPNQLGEVQQNMQPIQYAALPQMQLLRDGYAQMPTMLYKPGQSSDHKR